MKPRYWIAIAVLTALLFMGVTAHQFLCPPRWAVECATDATSGSRMKIMAPTERVANTIAAGLGRPRKTCTVFSVKRCPWDDNLVD